jgi:hypothetical protein
VASTTADRSVTVRLVGDVKPYIAELAKAETATRKLRQAMAATVTADADIRQAMTKIQDLSKEVGRLDGMSATVSADADVHDAMTRLAEVGDELRDLNGRSARVEVEVDTGSAMNGMDKLVQAGGKVGAEMGGEVSGALATALKTGAGPALIGALGGVAVTAGPAIGAAMGGAIVAGIGVKLTTLGVSSLFAIQEIDKSWSAVEKKRVEAANRQAETLQKQFAELNRDLTLGMKDASQPLLDVLDEARVQARGLGKDVGPSLREGFEQARLPLKEFLRDASAGVKELGDSIPSLMDGFGDVLGEIDIKGLLSDLGREFDELGRTVSDNRSMIGTVLNGLLAVLPMAVDGLGKLIGVFSQMGHAVITSAAAISEGMAGVTGVITDVGTRVLGVVRTIGEALSNVPGMEEFGRKIVQGADAGIRKLHEFKKQADEASRAVRLKADIVDLEQKVDRSLTLLDDPDLSKERRAEITAEIKRLVEAKGEAVRQLGDPALVAEYKSDITAEISELKNRLAEARKDLKDPDLTKQRKSELRAEIGQLQASVKLAKAALDSIKNKTVTVTTIYASKSGQEAIANKVRAAGGIQSADGRVNFMAAGGMLPAIKDTPTLNPMSNTIWAEAGREAYIPYDGKYRSRALDILGQVASDFGLEVVNRKAADSIGNVAMAIDSTGLEVVDGLQSAVDAMSQTMGQAGTLTGAMDRVGVVGQSVAETWQSGSQLVAGTVSTVSGQLGASMTGWGEVVSVSVADMSSNVGSSVGGLGKEVVSLGDVISRAADVVRAVANAKTAKPMGSAGAVIGPGAPKKGSTPMGSSGAVIGPGAPKKSSGMGSEGAVIGYVPSLEAAPAPLNPHSSGVSGGTAGSSGWNAPTNTSRVSAPQQVSSSSSYTSQSSSGGSSGGSSWDGGSGSSSGTPLVAMYGTVIREDMDADVVTAKIGMAVDSRG